MPKLDLEVPADIRQFGGIRAPDGVGQSHGAHEWLRGLLPVKRPAAGPEHMPVEWCVLARQKT
ncbi:MAG: hypothetical protein H6Q97_1039, partial [Nitrospirae bacterium]|nr:hypothetical protein [Nitrospirota bacterium]